ncbi:hypothetical protein DMUE_0076 [Dictyocoela muelleri]|nr:hypothetical protein DMUE_0076 [Dictyocoela muelleri]
MNSNFLFLLFLHVYNEPINLKFVIKNNDDNKEDIEKFMKTITEKLIKKLRNDYDSEHEVNEKGSEPDINDNGSEHSLNDKEPEHNINDKRSERDFNDKNINSKIASSISLVTISNDQEKKTGYKDENFESNKSNYKGNDRSDVSIKMNYNSNNNILKSINDKSINEKSINDKSINDKSINENIFNDLEIEEFKNDENSVKDKININPEIIEKLAKLFLKVKEYSENNSQYQLKNTIDKINRYEEFLKNEIFISGLDMITTIKNYYEKIAKEFKSDNPVIKNIIVYENNGEIRDYWGILKFNNELIDDSGIFKGLRSSSKGILSRIGFFKINDEDDGEDYNYLKKLLERLANSLKKDLYQIFKENKKLSMIDRLIYSRNFVDRGNCQYVCECSDFKCETPCKRIRCIERS